MPVPNTLALVTPPDGAAITAAPLRNDYVAIQAALNTLIGYLSGAGDGNALVYNAATQAWAARARDGRVNVKDPAYGAKGDGLDATDDAPAINAAVAAAVAAGASTVHFPAGTYVIHSYITVGGGGITLSGDGRATLKLGSGYVSGAQGQGHIFATGQSDLTIDGLRFDGNGSVLAPDATNNFAVWLTDCPRATIDDCYATAVNSGGGNANAAFLWTGNSPNGEASGNEIINCEGGGLFFQRNHCTAVGNVLNACNDVGIVFNSQNCHSCTATGNVINNIPAQAAFGCEAGAYNWTITGNAISSCFAALDCNDAGYVGAALGGGIFAANVATDLDKGASAQTFTAGVLYRAAKLRDVKIVNNTFSGLTAYGATDAFVFVNVATEGLTIKGNTFEGKAQALPACVVFSGASTHTRPVIADNTFRSTSSVTKLQRGIWLGNGSTYVHAQIKDNYFENISAYAVFFDTVAAWNGQLKDNLAESSVAVLYQASPWGTFAPGVVIRPHVLSNAGRSVWYATAAPVAGTWLQGDQVWNFSVAAAGVPGWVCTTGGTPGVWKAMAAVAA